MSKVYVFLGGPAAYGAQDKREAWMPKGDLPYFDKVARQRFASRREKRAWLKAHGMRECGELINPSKHIEGRGKSSPRPYEPAVKQFIQSQGGVEGLLRRVQERRGHFL